MKTPAGEWIKVAFALDQFQATSLGQIVQEAGPVDPRQVTSIGVLLGLKVWRHGLEAFANGHGAGRLAGDRLQMPGVFLLSDKEIVREFRHETAADRPDYPALTQ